MEERGHDTGERESILTARSCNDMINLWENHQITHDTSSTGDRDRRQQIPRSRKIRIPPYVSQNSPRSRYNASPRSYKPENTPEAHKGRKNVCGVLWTMGLGICRGELVLQTNVNFVNSTKTRKRRRWMYSVAYIRLFIYCRYIPLLYGLQRFQGGERSDRCRTYAQTPPPPCTREPMRRAHHASSTGDTNTCFGVVHAFGRAIVGKMCDAGWCLSGGWL